MLKAKNASRYLSTGVGKMKVGLKEFPIPYEIKRSPTDLLKALATATMIEKDKSAPHFGLVDDSRFVSPEVPKMMNYYLVKEYGKRAARQLAMEWPTLFMWDYDEPRIEAFRPTKPLDPKELDVSEKNLTKLIQAKQVGAAYEMFTKLHSKNVDGLYDKDLYADLLALCAFYNSQEVPLTELDEWHGARNFLTEKYNTIWKDNNLAYKIFSTLKTDRTYSIMIAGLSKYNRLREANELYKEMRSLKMIPEEEAYNALIASGSFNKAIYLLKEMNEEGVKPSIATINSCLLTIKKEVDKFIKNENNKDLPIPIEETNSKVTAIIMEMKRLNLKPHLATYELLLSCLDPLACIVQYQDESKPPNEIVVNALNCMLTHLESLKSINAKTDQDRLFFGKALNVAINANNYQMADRVEKLYSSVKNNVKLLPFVYTDFISESYFYQNYMMYRINACDLSEAGEIYMACIPKYLRLNQRMYSSLFRRIIDYQTLNQGKTVKPYWTFLRRLIDDYQLDGHLAKHSSFRTNSLLRTALLQVDVKQLPINIRTEYRKYIQRMIILFRSLGRAEKTTQIPMDPYIVIEIVIMYMNAGLYHKGACFMKKLAGFIVPKTKKTDMPIQKSKRALFIRKTHGFGGLNVMGEIPSEDQLEELLNFILTRPNINKLHIGAFMRITNMYYPQQADKYKVKIENALPKASSQELEELYEL